MAGHAGIEPTPSVSKTEMISISPMADGTPGRIRTFNSLLLREVRLPVAPLGYYLVLPLGIEPSSTVLQTAAMTTSAKVALVPAEGIEPSQER